MASATFRFYEELNDFLGAERRGREFVAPFARRATTKHAIEALGVPHGEVELILVNGESVDFDRVLADGDRVAVYPRFEALDITPVLRVRREPLRAVRFAADSHLGGLARLLRMTGFDTLYDNGWQDAQIERVAREEHRILLTRDRALLKRRTITHGCYVHAQRCVTQLEEVFQRLDLARSARPFTRCMNCNAPLRAVEKSQVCDALPPGVYQAHDRFSRCTGCARIYWQGSHWRRMRALVEALLPTGPQSVQPATTVAPTGAAAGAVRVRR